MTNQKHVSYFIIFFIFLLKCMARQQRLIGKLFVNAWKQIVGIDNKKIVQIWMKWKSIWAHCSSANSDTSVFFQIPNILTENFVITHYTALNLIWVICKAEKVSNYLLFCRKQQANALCLKFSCKQRAHENERNSTRKQDISDLLSSLGRCAHYCINQIVGGLAAKQKASKSYCRISTVLFP